MNHLTAIDLVWTLAVLAILAVLLHWGFSPRDPGDDDDFGGASPL